MNTRTQRRLEQAVGTVAHNRDFTLRDLAEYVRQDGISTAQVRSMVRSWERVGHLTRTGVAPVRYYPTRALWDVVEIACGEAL